MISDPNGHPSRRVRRLLPIAVVVLAQLTAAACGKREASPTAGAPRVSPTAPDVRPVISRSPQAGTAAWAGLAEPRGAALDDQGRLWVTDFGHSRVLIYDGDGGLLGTLGGARGNGKYQLQEPGDITIAGNDVYVADTWNGRVQHYSTAGEFQETTAIQLYGPRGVAVAPGGSVWITDTGNNRIAMRSGTKALLFYGKPGKGPGEFASPVGIAVGPSGRVYVADVGNRRLEMFSRDGVFLRSIAVPQWGGPVEPHLLVDAEENLFLTAPGTNQVVQLDPSGGVVKKWDTDDAGHKLIRPIGLALDAKRRVLTVVNSGNNTVVRLSLRGKSGS